MLDSSNEADTAPHSTFQPSTQKGCPSTHPSHSTFSLNADKSNNIEVAINPNNKTITLQPLITTVLSWNIEGFHKNLNNFTHFISIHRPTVLFLTEPQTFQHNLSCLFQTFRGDLFAHLNSEDSHSPELAM